jgi:hypothetical protein
MSSRSALRTSCAVAALAAAALSATGLSSGATTGQRKLTVYAVATAVQFLNQADDRARGNVNNPFNAGVDKLQPKAQSQGPYPGDVTIYSFDLFTGANRKTRAGSAAYTCYYNFAAHALCKVSYELSGNRGTIVASGPVNFNVSGFTLVVTGGTQKYVNARGQVVAVPAAKNSQRLDFVMT